MRTFKEIFEEYGADYQKTIARFMGNDKMYMKFLGMLFQDPSMEKLGQALKDKDYGEAFTAAHTLKGVTANMGLTPLFDRVCAIVEPLRLGEAREDYPDMYREIEDEFHRVEGLRDELSEVI